MCAAWRKRGSGFGRVFLRSFKVKFEIMGVLLWLPFTPNHCETCKSFDLSARWKCNANCRRRCPVPASFMDLGVSRLDLDVDVEIKSPHHGPVTWLDIDSAEERYLLTGLAVRTCFSKLSC